MPSFLSRVWVCCGMCVCGVLCLLEHGGGLCCAVAVCVFGVVWWCRVCCAVLCCVCVCVCVCAVVLGVLCCAPGCGLCCAVLCVCVRAAGQIGRSSHSVPPLSRTVVAFLLETLLAHMCNEQKRGHARAHSIADCFCSLQVAWVRGEVRQSHVSCGSILPFGPCLVGV
jgi:hypothetical protein